ncbi:18S rRNA (guanine-N(7))-methyltransferase isoform X1 [Equus asinus]|uniref:18S rRNA (Guanine-N(7))-methyltransferase n=1 Tax=Equus przewalskii TaxID=9798 RepID=A0ABM4K2Z2_EQUPR|nr:probable 18S rRNA (guanine-N(7))-methyltransferase isoform X4 [Equus caballus]XP_014705940.1 probable 18S rRNA (guanine-N(7))-methyltransferase isoform X1 [Equus asinus]XP_046523127.1 probable 18S rRNA (guanine-N(7))-methyltransferase [Equus quagga]
MACRGRRPEHGGPPELFYDKNEARKYVRNSRMIDVQTKMARRALELLYLPEDRPCYLLDIGCGSGLSGDYLSYEGHYWVGIDISPAMLDAALDREIEGDLLLGDMGQGLPFKPGSFDGCISISAVQWLCNANKTSDIPAKRLYCFFSSLYSVLVRGSRAVLQLYPENSEQLELITTQATRAGFTGGVVVDYPNSTKAKKFYLCLFSGPSTFVPKGLNGNVEEEEAGESRFTSGRIPYRIARRGVVRKSREWVLEKKERRRRQGKEVRPDTQYTGRKRKPRF